MTDKENREKCRSIERDGGGVSQRESVESDPFLQCNNPSDIPGDDSLLRTGQG